LQCLGDVVGGTGAAHTDHRHPAQAERQRVGDRDDLHHAGVAEPLHSLTDRGLRQSDCGTQSCVRDPAVALQLFDDRPVGGVELGARSVHATDTGSYGAAAQGNPWRAQWKHALSLIQRPSRATV